jgi:hypothetical protein
MCVNEREKGEDARKVTKIRAEPLTLKAQRAWAPKIAQGTVFLNDSSISPTAQVTEQAMRARGGCEREVEGGRHSKGNENAGRAIDPEGLKGLGAKDSPRLLQR